MRVLEWEDLIGLLPDLTLEELNSYGEDQFRQRMARRAQAPN